MVVRRLILMCCFILVPSLLFAGTWSHRIVKTKNDGAVIVEFTRSPTNEIRCVTFSRIIGNGLEQLNRKKWNLEVNWSDLNRFDLGDEGGESKEILWKLVKAIRNNPSLTITQATSWYDTNYPDGLYNGTQLLLRMRRWLTNEIGFQPTWDQFKTYVQNHTFGEVDIYVP